MPECRGLTGSAAVSCTAMMRTVACLKAYSKNSIRDAHTPQPGEIVFNTMTYRSNETVERLGYFQCSVTYIKVQVMFK